MDGHAGPSGYDRCADGLDSDPITVSVGLEGLVPRAAMRLCRSVIESSGNTWYHRESLWGEVRTAAQWLTRTRTMFHFLYGENLYRYLGNLTKRFPKRNALLATYHTPGWRFSELVEDGHHLSALDGLIVMATEQKAFFSQFLDPNRIHFVPHGIDTDYFQPLNETGGEQTPHLSVITVGSHLRDFDTLRETAQLAAAQDVPVMFNVVCAPDKARQFDALGNVRTHSKLDDAALLRAYQNADALFLPLLDATANNALLEGLACGLPVVATDLSGVRDYTTPECRVLVPEANPEAALQSLKELSGKTDRLREMGKASRAAAESLSWPAIHKRLHAIYADIAAQRGW